MRTYNCKGFRSVQAETMREAAVIFGLRLAKKEFGRGATTGPITENSVAKNGSNGEYSVFIGTYDKKNKTMSGRNEWLIIFHAA